MANQTLTKFQVYHTPSKIPGKKGLPLAFVEQTLDFSVANPYVLDLSSLSQQGVELEVQTIEIDNTDNPNQVTLVYSEEIQLVRIFPASVIQAYTVPGVLNPRSIQITNPQNSGTIKVYLYGYPLPDSASINIQGSSSTLDTIATNTGDTAANLPNITNADDNDPADGLFTFSNPVKWTGTDFERVRLARTPLNGSGITATTGVVLASGNRLWNLKVWLSGDVIQAAAGDDLIQVLDGAVVVGQAKPYVPAASLGTIEKLILEIDFPDGYVVETGITISLANDLTGGNLYFNGASGVA